jgi:high affinity Mn2+ porin
MNARFALLSAALVLAASARAQNADIIPAQKPSAEADASTSTWYTMRFQATWVDEGDFNFHSEYSGNDSLSSRNQHANSITSTLFTGVRLAPGTEFYYNPEISGGRGLSSANGLAGFPNGEIYRVGDPEPTLYTARLYLQQRFGFGGGKEKQEDDENQIAETLDADRLTIVAGKFSLIDFFDNNAYAHDPRTQFLNWVLMGSAAWDYPADTRGYTWGAMTEYHEADWAVRGAVVGAPKQAHGRQLDQRIGRANGSVIEGEHAISLANGRKGTARLLAYVNQADMGNYDDAISLGQQTGTAPNVVATRAYGRTKYGFSFNADQEISDTLGVFTRDGWSDGANESWAFVEIDVSQSVGLEWKPAAWGRPDDRFGLAEVANELNAPHRRYFEDGGYGFMLGDGGLHYGPELITEAYYRVPLVAHLWVTPDYQFFVNPAYNRSRGPVQVYSLRLHAEL